MFYTYLPISFIKQDVAGRFGTFIDFGIGLGVIVSFRIGVFVHIIISVWLIIVSFSFLIVVWLSVLVVVIIFVGKCGLIAGFVAVDICRFRGRIGHCPG